MDQEKKAYLINICFVLLTGWQLLFASMAMYHMYQAGDGRVTFLVLFFCTLCLQSGIGIFGLISGSKRSWCKLIREMEVKLAQKNLRITVEE